MIWADKSAYYKGNWKNNEKHGHGEYYWNRSNDGKPNKKYIGEWRKNKMSGKGMLIWDDGRRYNGEFEDDERTGKGEQIWPWKYDEDCK